MDKFTNWTSNNYCMPLDRLPLLQHNSLLLLLDISLKARISCSLVNSWLTSNSEYFLCQSYVSRGVNRSKQTYLIKEYLRFA